MVFRYLVSGFIVKWITGIDDVLTRIPVLAAVTKTRTGKFAFSIGTLIAIILAILIAIFFSLFIRLFPYYRYIAATLIFLFAIALYFNLLVTKPKEKTEKKVKKIKQIKTISPKRFLKLIGIGFIVSFATVLDDIIAFAPLFLEATITKILAASGILLATVTQLIVVIYFSRQIRAIKYKKEIATVGLIILGLLILFEVI